MIGNDKVFIIAEAGVNHNGSLEIAKELILEAKNVGADAVKFQTWKTENVVTRWSNKAPYQDKLIGEQKSQFDMLKELELTYENFYELKRYCDNIGIEFMSTTDEYESAIFMNQLVHKIKIGSAELTDWPFLKKIAKFQKETILSTGMSTLEEVSNAIHILSENGLDKDKINVLHAHTAYPSDFQDLNLRCIVTLKEALNVNIGYSDHSLGIEAPIAAVALGARIIEKHFTLDSSMEGPDHKASLEIKEFANMVSAIRNIEKALGNGKKEPSNIEKDNIPFVRKSIVASRNIKEGEILSEENLTIKRPASGIPPIQWENVIGTYAIKDFKQDEIIEI